MENAVLEEYSVSYVNEENKVYTTPENGGQSNVDYSTMYTTFEVLEDGTFSFSKYGTGDDIQYSKDNGTTWTSLASDETISVVTGDKVMWKSTIAPDGGIGKFSSSNKFNAYGNTMSLLYGDDFKEQTSLKGDNSDFSFLFNGNKGLIDASNLILPATTLSWECYKHMFSSCHSLTTAPSILPATTLAQSCYVYMFYDCKNLTAAPELPATTLYGYCYQYMFSFCTNLTTAPILHATSLKTSCYDAMFLGCSSLNHITMLATSIGYNSLKRWVKDVSSTGTFVKHTDMNDLPLANALNYYAGIPEGWEVKNHITPTECTTLTI